jgi:hypothetical protein
MADQQPGEQGPTQVVVTDLDMHFGSIVWLLVKFALAAIPAMVILAAFALAAFLALRAMLGWD